MHKQLERILADGDALEEDFDGTRDRLLALPIEAVPGLLAAAQDPAYASVRGLLWYGLADWGYPPALERFVQMLDDPDDDVVIAGAFALDRAAGGRFAVSERFITAGWPDHEGMRTLLAPEVRAWWAEHGASVLPSLEAWRAERAEWAARAPTRSGGIDPSLIAWVFEHKIALTGTKGVVRDPAEVLPANKGTHLVPGTVRIDDQDVEAVVLVDSAAGRIDVALVPDPGSEVGWRPVAAVGVRSAFATEGVEPTGGLSRLDQRAPGVTTDR